jgi:hypothetical protein
MTAVSLFDLLARAGAGAGNGERARDERLMQFAQGLVEEALADWERVRRYEEEFTSADWEPGGLGLEVTRSLYSMYEKWAADAEQVLARTRELATQGWAVASAESLEDAYGRVKARLKLTPEMVARAMEQVRQGQTVPAKELRDELRARIRA